MLLVAMLVFGAIQITTLESMDKYLRTDVVYTKISMRIGREWLYFKHEGGEKIPDWYINVNDTLCSYGSNLSIGDTIELRKTWSNISKVELKTASGYLLFDCMI